MTSQPPKDFLALSHGHEWVNFYESFDMLVQDHLTRSSELLRKAMSLPEVADREVAQVRDDLEMQLKNEREHNHATLSVLQDEIGNSREQVSSLAAMVTALLTNFDNLSQTVDAAISTATSTAQSVPVDGFVDSPDATAVLAEAEATDSAEVEAEEVVAESEGDEVDAEAAWEQLADEVDAGADTDSEDDGEIDLNALAEAEEETEPEEGADDSTNGERTRPHWLSMSRASDS